MHSVKLIISDALLVFCREYVTHLDTLIYGYQYIIQGFLRVNNPRADYVHSTFVYQQDKIEDIVSRWVENQQNFSIITF